MSRRYEISCWQCSEMTSLETRNEFDGCCWACGVEIDLEDYLIKELDKHDEHYAALSAVTAERDRLQRMVEVAQTGLQDPVTVFVNMKRGTIAKPSLRSMIDLYGGVVNGEDAQLLEIAKLRADRDRLQEEMGDLWKQLDKFRSQSHGITALAEIERLRAEVDSLRKAFMKMRNVAAGYSNCCEFDSANTRRLEREFEAADELFRSSAALAAKEA